MTRTRAAAPADTAMSVVWSPAAVAGAADGWADADDCALGAAEGGSTDGGGGCDGGALGLKSSSTGRGTVSDFGSGSNATQPKPLNSTSGQAIASAPRISWRPSCVWKPTPTRVGR